MARCVAGGVVGVTLVACFLSPLPDVRTPADRAHELDAKCRGVPESLAAPFLSPAAIDGVEPATAYVMGGPNGHESRLRGARIHFRPLPGATKESIARALECHAAGVVLGRIGAREDDPYTLPGRWLVIEVESERDGFVAVVTSDDLDDARRVLERARALGRARVQPPPASAPPSAAPVSPPPASSGDAASGAGHAAFTSGLPLQTGLALVDGFAGQQ